MQHCLNLYRVLIPIVLSSWLLLSFAQLAIAANLIGQTVGGTLAGAANPRGKGAVRGL